MYQTCEGPLGGPSHVNLLKSMHNYCLSSSRETVLKWLHLNYFLERERDRERVRERALEVFGLFDSINREKEESEEVKKRKAQSD